MQLPLPLHIQNTLHLSCHMPTLPLTMNKLINSPFASLPSLMMLFFLVLFLGSFAFSRSSPLPRNVSHSDEQALLGFKAAITLDPNNSFITWTPNASFCTWRGVTCSAYHYVQIRVVRLNLSSLGLEGTISPLLGNLSALHSLDLSYNALGGHIPPQLGNLSHAKILRLVKNQLEGNIPASLGRCSSLVKLALSYNQLQGSIPPELGLLSRLEFLALGGNSLTGSCQTFWTIAAVEGINQIKTRELISL